MIILKKIERNSSHEMKHVTNGVHKLHSWFDCLNTFRDKYQPSTTFGLFCTKMSLVLSGEHRWVSIPCNDYSASIAVCQYQWTQHNHSLKSLVYGEYNI